ncbi:TrmB family transcriptional regulator sugar-binding domain-containing protein [Halorussus salinisoli]|uniref:TrmB family transcriptional regulator sugar-binding domain-containing protein n=1 Tax=Halorussus salinisoli TaxID=2558242 RepID=UPI0010C186CD|nr:TrmB family transcriptional regulator [Halorussus salinisoli]
MESAELVATLERYGLSPYQATAYVTVLERGTLAAQEVADRSSVPRPRVYDILRDLEEQGFVTTYEQDKLYVQALDPENALKDVRARAAELEAAVEEITDRWQQPAVKEHTISLVQRGQTVFEKARDELDHAVDHAQLVCTTDHLEALRPTLTAAHGRDVFVDVSLYDVEEDESLSEYDFSELCTHARVLRRPLRSEPFGALIDRERACYSWHPATDNEYGIYVDDSAHENMVWNYMMDLRDAAEEHYVATPYEPPLRFGALRDCLHAVEPLVRDGRTLTADVEGTWAKDGRRCAVSGTIVDIDYSGFESDESATPLQMFTDARLTLDTGEETHSVGGFDALVEDIEATRVVVTDIE